MARARLAAVHQPNFFPWLGYFNKLATADVFIVLDDAQHTKTGGNWSNRVRLLIGAEARWVTAPIRRPTHGVVPLCEVEWAGGQPWREKMVKSLETNYRRAAFYTEIMSLLVPLIRNPEQRLAAFNLHAIRSISAALGIHKEVILASALGVTASSNQRLIELTRSVDCDGYLAGGGADGYQDESAFARAGLQLKCQSFTHPVYPQAGSLGFVPGLSVIDALMHVGQARTSQLVNP